MARQQVSECLKFEELQRRPELSDEELQFCIDHPSRCDLGIHTRAGRIRTRESMLSAVGVEDVSERVPLGLHLPQARREADEEALVIGGPWLSQLGDAAPLQLTGAVSLSQLDGGSATDIVEVSLVQMVELRQRLPWIGKRLRIARSMTVSPDVCVYSVDIDVTSQTKGPQLQVVLADRENRRSSAILSRSAPATIFAGAVSVNEWSSMSLSMAPVER